MEAVREDALNCPGSVGGVPAAPDDRWIQATKKRPKIWKKLFPPKVQKVPKDTHTQKSNGSANLLVSHSNGGIQLASTSIADRENNWLKDSKSLGTLCNPIVSRHGSLQCWEIAGEAQIRTRELQARMQEVVNEYSVEFSAVKGRPFTTRPLLATVFMSGKTENKVLPTLVLSGQRKARRLAMKHISDGKYLDPYEATLDVKIRMVEVELEKMPVGGSNCSQARGLPPPVKEHPFPPTLLSTMTLRRN